MKHSIVLSLLSIMALVFSLVSCGDDDDGLPTASSSSNATVINVSSSSSAPSSETSTESAASGQSSTASTASSQSSTASTASSQSSTASVASSQSSTASSTSSQSSAGGGEIASGPFSILYTFGVGEYTSEVDSVAPAGITASDLTAQGANIKPAGVTGKPGKAASIDKWSTSADYDGSTYVYITITASGKTIKPGNLSWDTKRSGTGPASMVFRTSIDNYSANVGEIFSPDSSNFEARNLGLSSLAGIQNSLTIRLYGWNASGTAGTCAIDNLKFEGTLE